MEIDSVNIVPGEQVGTKIDSLEAVKQEKVLGNKADRGEEEEEGNVDMDMGDVNMEASISADDVMRAGGFGARDDISNFLPVASDSTDFEASLRDAREYEEPQKEICRPGLGWKDDVKD